MEQRVTWGLKVEKERKETMDQLDPKVLQDSEACQVQKEEKELREAGLVIPVPKVQKVTKVTRPQCRQVLSLKTSHLLPRETKRHFLLPALESVEVSPLVSWLQRGMRTCMPGKKNLQKLRIRTVNQKYAHCVDPDHHN